MDNINLNASGLKKHKIGVFAIVGTMYSLCAAGAYGIEDMISWSGPGLTIIMLLVLPIVWAIPMALVAAELGSAIPEEGGMYKWVQRGCGEFWGFQAGWWRTIASFAAVPIYVVLAGDYLASVMGWNGTQRYMFEIAIILVITYINLRGVKDAMFLSTLIWTGYTFLDR